MPVITRFSSLSDIEFERELEHHLQGGQLVLGAEMTSELMERVRVWVETADNSDIENLQQEVEELENEISDLKEELENANA